MSDNMSETYTQWMLARYVADLGRREPKNVGVIVLRGNEGFVQLIGQRSPISIEEEWKINGRMVGGTVHSLRNLKAWAKYWSREVKKGKSVSELTSISRPSAYYLEVGGMVLKGKDENLQDFAGWLFEELVSAPAPTKKRDSPKDRARNLFQELDIQEEVEADVFLQDGLGNVSARFDFKYQNGVHNYMNLISGSSWDKTLASVAGFHEAESRKGRSIALVYSTDLENADREEQLRLVKARANTFIELDGSHSLTELGRALHVIH